MLPRLSKSDNHALRLKKAAEIRKAFHLVKWDLQQEILKDLPKSSDERYNELANRLDRITVK